MSFRKVSAIAVAGGLLTAGGVSAATLDFSYQLTSSFFVIDASWTQSDSPTPITAASGEFADIAVSDGVFAFGAIGGPLTPGAFSDVDFYNLAYSGPLGPGGFEAGPVGDFGPQLFSGDETAPVFAPGSYALANGTLSVTAVPEPSAWSLMLVGFGGLGGTLRSRTRTARIPQI